MDSNDATAAADLFSPGRINLEECPRCGYSLKGLPESHCCPECGFAYDDRTFVLTGISRGATSMAAGRKWLWVAVVLGAWLGPMLLVPLFLSGEPLFAAGLAAAWLGLVVWLLMTGRRERRGVETFIFAAGGFGYCADLTPSGVTHAQLTPWQEVNAVLVERKGAHWHRIRIGLGYAGRLRQVCFDVGVRCDERSAAWIHSTILERIAAARRNPPPGDQPARIG